MTLLCDAGVILLGEVRYWSLLGVKRLGEKIGEVTSRSKRVKQVIHRCHMSEHSPSFVQSPELICGTEVI